MTISQAALQELLGPSTEVYRWEGGRAGQRWTLKFDRNGRHLAVCDDGHYYVANIFSTQRFVRVLDFRAHGWVATPLDVGPLQGWLDTGVLPPGAKGLHDG
ncbi:MAG: hypothetical protein HC882_08035 [Acidobacteria bacterium]|nr:hypothetical protein [Acidobacteriota bacterium]